MKKALLVINAAILLFVISGLTMAVDKLNLSGTWQLNSERTEGLEPGIDQVMTVKQQGEKIELVTKVSLPNGEVRDVADSYLVNDKELEFEPKTFDGDKGKGKRIAKWTANGLVVVETAEFPNGAKTKMTRTWTLSADGKELVIVLDLDGPQGKVVTKRVFNKG